MVTTFAPLVKGCVGRGGRGRGEGRGYSEMEGNITQYADWVTLVTCDQWGQWSVVTTRYHHHTTT